MSLLILYKAQHRRLYDLPARPKRLVGRAGVVSKIKDMRLDKCFHDVLSL